MSFRFKVGVSVHNNHVESKLVTKYGEFNIRVYEAPQGRETVVLWKGSLSSKSPLVRIHSECLTGDVFCGLNCDCGEQLAKALTLISKEGGILIYLRQEGRGIGLFEKIKSYHFQKQGYDTVEANVLLGHGPDERTYEMAKVALEDLQVKRVRLLTNNPAKVSELAKYGIEVEERVPLIIKPNKYNRQYLITKRNKFNHSFNNKARTYFYQFHADTPEHVKAIGDFLVKKRNDPFLMICVGITTNRSLLKGKKEVARIRSIYDACKSYERLIPILHFSFHDSSNVPADFRMIKGRLPFIERLQVNDLPSIKPEELKFGFRLFSLDVPFSDENFKVLRKKELRSMILRNKAYVLLDNSKGRGIQEPKASLMKKIEVLLNYRINDIAIFGGFGPNELQNFFDLKKYYQLNFSIDAETKLKTHGSIDVEKTKSYLQQLISHRETEKSPPKNPMAIGSRLKQLANKKPQQTK